MFEGSQTVEEKLNQWQGRTGVEINQIGRSILQKPIYEVVIGNGPRKVHWNGGFHGNEWMTSMALLDVLEAFFKGTDIKELLSNVTLSVVPMVNPDGVDLVIHGPSKASAYGQMVKEWNGMNRTFSSWKANIRGVDLNKQFPAGWFVEKERKPAKPSFRDYPGPYPLSEPEAFAMYRLAMDRDFDRVLCFHSQGEVIYYGYEGKEPANSEVIVQAFEKVSGYEPIRTIDSHAGMKDWFIQAFKKEAYTVEIGKGINPLPLSQYLLNVEHVKQICLQSLH
ncbi:M14 family metallopeptidase [Thalassobacillus hwangdonensis]|uniref:M14 family metallocarboxypeptidase n=1 Tax=Thalassobacillus hwangdonensis TaxID=546108 RepID=A0ABW3L0P6_9BACI